LYYNGELEQNDSGTWSLSGNSFTATTTSSNKPSHVGSVFTATIALSDNNNTLTFNHSNGDKDVYHRTSTTPVAPQHTNADLASLWIIHTSEPPTGGSVYINFDGNGTITELGSHDSTSPAGTYSVTSDGTFSMVLGSATYPGTIMSPTSAIFSDQHHSLTNIPLDKVINTQAMSGNWTGTITKTSSPTKTYNVSFTVGSSGTVSNFVGLTSPVSGRLLSLGTNVAFFVKTGEALGSYVDQLWLMSGTINGNTVTGTFKDDNDTTIGTITLTIN
jgi:hypothetical protein